MSVLAMVVAIGDGAMVHATDYSGTNGAIIKSSKSKDGRDYKSDKKKATSGNTGGSMNDRNFGILGDRLRTGTQVRLRTQGGKGGDGGHRWNTMYNHPYKPTADGADGGDGGRLSFVQSGTIVTQSADQFFEIPFFRLPVETPLILLQSKGGAGGVAPKWSSQFMPPRTVEGTGGKGGDGGATSLTIRSSTGVSGSRYAIARLRSWGGEGGAGNSQTATNKGGDGGAVSAEIVAQTGAGQVTVSTNGANAPALILESIGGTGGKSGYQAVDDKARAASGGNGALVAFETSVNTRISTAGASSPAVVLQSIGGTGGAASTSSRNGGDGGNGGDVVARLRGNIMTSGDFAFGLVAQSVSGNGGLGASGVFSGSDGGASGKPGKVDIENHGLISTLGDGATAIVAQSIGGGNGMNAFDASAGTYTKGGGGDGGKAGWLSFLGGSGGDGGRGSAGGQVSVSNFGRLATFGTAAHGIQAQSIGGHGGEGGSAGGWPSLVSVSIGGDGGGGGDGGNLVIGDLGAAIQQGHSKVPAGSSIRTSGGSSYAIFAQSVGGGGGAGGASSTKSGAFLFPAVAVSIGGSGGKGGKGGAVKVGNTSDLRTEGQSSIGIFAQSIGGGGGDGGAADASTIAVSAVKVPAISVPISVGGSGGEGGDGQAVTVVNAGAITTLNDDATGIVAQSLGGGGGSAGDASSYALAMQLTGSTPAVNIGIAIGGSAGGGGNGGAISLSNHAHVATYGANSSGLVGRSIGGGGGTGGAASSTGDLLAYSNSIATSVAIGGSGGDGGRGGNVSVNQDGLIETHADFSHGAYGISVGGGGGDGGTANAASNAGISADWFTDYGFADVLDLLDVSGNYITANVAVGGSGGGGGRGGYVSVQNTGAIGTNGNNSSGIVARSIGGGGGDAGGYQGGGDTTLDFNVSIGGSGGDGGNGGTVSVSNSGAVATHGSGSHGVFAQTVGGGGGNGGSFTGEVNPRFTSLEAFDLIVEVFSEIAALNDVTKKLADTKDTASNFHDDASLQKSIASLKAIVAYGKELKKLSEKDAADIHEKIAKNTALLTMLAVKLAAAESVKSAQQEIKNALVSKDAESKIHDLIGASVNVSVGGSGGKGGNGGNISASNGGTIQTLGENSFGVFAQSIGGGGGTGGAAYASGKQKLNATVGIGGSGGAGGKGGDVVVSNGGTILTAGDGSYGVFAQSVGGGGGLGGASQTDNSLSFSATVTVGGNGGAKGHGGAVEVTNSGTVATGGANAHGIVAQSVGGGGGAYFVNIHDPATKPPEEAIDAELAALIKEASHTVEELLLQAGLIDESAMTDLDIEDGEALFNDASTVLPKPQITVTLGGNGSAAGDGGAVNVTHTGAVSTNGDGSIGIFAQSVGGGGGMGKNATSGGFLPIGSDPSKEGAVSLSDFSLGGRGGAAGQGGAVSVALGAMSSVATRGDASHGIFAQSVGGGGGYGGVGTTNALYGSVTFGGESNEGGSSGDGGAVNISMAGATTNSSMTISTIGEQSHGIYAQSVGGGGGAITVLNANAGATTAEKRGASKGRGGAITIDTVGSISATGTDANAIYAQSGFQNTDGSLAVDTSKGRAISISHDGVLTGGSGTGAAVYVDGGNTDNKITFGKNAIVQALSGTAIYGSFGNEEIVNNGVLVGDIKVNSGRPKERNWFYNNANAIYRSVDDGIVDLGTSSGHFFYNAGQFDVGGVENVSTVTVDGNLIVQDGGSLLVDVVRDDGGTLSNDFISVTRDVVFEEGGGVDPYITGDLQNGDTFTILKAERNLSGEPITINDASPIKWTYSTESDGTLRMVVDGAAFRGAAMRSLTPTEDAMLAAWQQAWDSNDAHAAGFFGAIANADTAQDYDDAIESVSPESQLQQVAHMTLATSESLSSALSCPMFVGEGTLLQETECVWGEISHSRSKIRDSSAGDGFDNHATTLRMGAQKEFASNWFLGGSLGFGQTSGTSADGFTKNTGDSVAAALALKYQMGPWLFSGAAHLGYGGYTMEHVFDVGDAVWAATASPHVGTAGLRLRADYELAFPDWYLRPSLEVDAIHSSMSGYDLMGDTFDMRVDSMRQWTYAARPAIETGARYNLGDQRWLRVYSLVGLTWRSTDGLSTGVTVHNNNQTAFSFRSTTALPDRLYDLTAGVELKSGDNYKLSGEYIAKIGDNYRSQMATLRLSMRF
ncbi:autotransporter outer membrane beta-barrel domain-containing protein [Pontibaca salina]|uniref:Autotransporter domain-containing protein n=1 Tax=Pontibaca salina TaxID=2795731 RepID=A0A934HSW3_9RHOB|nr:autotransporter outer membrane beta-barrel domain-containing protein [Pontibaca salina]MBI6630802.1 hypothetical protein [Pontibaca salina]